MLFKRLPSTSAGGCVLRATQECNTPMTQSSEVTTKIPDDLPKVAVDRQQICQVFINLIINAAQAMGKNGRIEIWVEQSDQNIVVQFSDNGPGIPQEMLGTIFEPFVSTKGQSGGIGLGLYISKEIIESHGGNLLVKSTDGKGTCFTIQLPIVDPATDEESGGQRSSSPGFASME